MKAATRLLAAPLVAAAQAFLPALAGASGADDANRMVVADPVVCEGSQLRPGVTLKRLVFGEPRLMVAYVARVDMATPGIGFTATERDPLWGEPMPDFTNETWLVSTKRETTVDFMSRRRGEGKDVEIAFNTSGYRPWGGAGCRCAYGAFYRWVLADGNVLSHGRPPGMGAYFVVRRDGSAFIRTLGRTHATNDWAFAMYGNRALLVGGRRTKFGMRGDRRANLVQLAPRTAVGLSPDGKTLVVLALDGRQPGYSEGATFADVADILLKEGCADAVNFDGGGSTSLVAWDREDGRPKMLNRHANGYMRKVALNLGITFPGPESSGGIVADFLSKGTEERVAILADVGRKSKFRHVVPRPEDGPPRFVVADGVSNMRDIGGWKGLGGRRVRHGLAYRSAAFDTGVRFRRAGRDNYEYLFGLSAVEGGEKADFKPAERTIADKGIDVLVKGLGIRSDLDLRSPHECHGMTASPLGAGVKWFHCPQLAYGNFGKDESRRAFAKAFRVFLDESNYPVVFHCAGGADRTGAVAFMLNGICGVSLDDLRKDWELTAFGTSHAENPGFTHARRFDRLVAVIEKEPGETLADKAASYVRSCGFTDADIAHVREIMLGPGAASPAAASTNGSSRKDKEGTK
ncbi:MAG: tyrosine-protein phosphatase [Kiritimatiellae bacterium]|nr:tyrosine-protein phosphatase [Kiritimatiellia bacterium]